MDRAALAVGRTRQGRQTIHSMALASPSRNAVAPEVPTRGNRCLASTAPNWMLHMARASTAIGMAVERGLNPWR